MSETYPAAVAPVISLLLPLIRSLHGDALSSSPHLIDRTVQQFLREVGRQVTEGLCAEAARDAVAQARAAAAAQRKKLVIERSPTIRFACLFGWICVVSPYLREAGPKPAPVAPDAPFLGDEQLLGVRPVNDALRVRGGGRTVQLTRVLADFGLDSSFEGASAKVFEHYGLKVHRTTVRRATLQQGERAERVASMPAYAPPPTAEAGPTLLAEMDGSCVRTGELIARDTPERTPKRGLPKRTRVTTWRDLRLAFVRRLHLKDPVFVGGILSLADVAERLRGEAIALGWTRDTPTVRITDGGHGVREALDRVFPTGVHILDRPHLHHHLFETAKAMGLGDDDAHHTVRGWSKRLAAGNVGRLLGELEAYEGQGKDRVLQLAGYLERFRDAVAYDAFQELGYPIGSGEIESAHKGQVQARFKLRGTWWTPDNVNCLLALRLCRTNGRWEEHWETQGQRAA